MLANRIREICTTEGTGNITLNGPLAGHISFSDAFPVGDSCCYVIEDGDNYEIGVGTLIADNVISRYEVKETFYNGVLTRKNPTPISVSGNSKISCVASLNRYDAFVEAFERLKQESQKLRGGVVNVLRDTSQPRVKVLTNKKAGKQWQSPYPKGK